MNYNPTLVLDWTGSLHNKHFLTREEHTKQVVTWPQGPYKVSRRTSEQTMHSSCFSSSIDSFCAAAPAAANWLLGIWSLQKKDLLSLFSVTPQKGLELGPDLIQRSNFVV